MSLSRVVCNFVSSSCNSFEKEVASKLNDIIQKLEIMASQKDVLGLMEGAPRSKASQARLTASLVNESDVYGRKEDKEQLIQLLLSLETDHGDNVGRIAIVGKGGLGKTTLAKLAYNDDRLEQQFDLKLWLYVSDDFDVLRVTKSALESITQQPCLLQSLETIQVQLREKVRGKKFLVVLDDVWSERIEDWELLCCPFDTGADGSRVIVTTRSEGVASIMDAFSVVQLNKLSYDDGWSLFSRYAFRSGSSAGADLLLVEMGQKIVQKCDGLPLAIKTLGGLLRSKLERKHWEKILHSNLWDLPGGNNDILPALSLSYCFLASHLKRCFAYCAMFPKGYEYEKEKLVLLWMAGGFLESPNNNIELEEVGDECFMELLSRSFFDKASNINGVQYYVIHDLVHDLAKFVSGDFCAHLENNKAWKISDRTCHTMCDLTNCGDFRSFEALFKAKSPQSFIYKGSWISDRVAHEILPELGHLRVLSLSVYKIIELPTAIGDLKKLRLLDVSSTHIILLPESICTLCNLQTLLLKGCRNLEKVPPAIGNLTQLRYLDVSGTRIKVLPESICMLYNLQTLLLRGCRCVQKLPQDMWKLSSLRCLAICGSNVKEMPKRMSKLENLQALDMFVVGKVGGSSLAELQGLRHIGGKLLIKGLENVANVGDAQEADLKGMGNLEDLRFEFDLSSSTNSERQGEVLENLRPHAGLKTLKISHYGGTSFPSWLGDHSFQSMTFLHLSNCVFCESLPSLGQLPSLKVLKVEGTKKVQIVGAEFYSGGSPFRCLEEIEFNSMGEWEEWVVEGVEFPHLKILILYGCPKLRRCLPARLPSLKQLKILYCEQFEGPIPQLESISQLLLTGCDKVELREIFKLTTLTTLKLEKLPQLINMPPGLLELPSLEHLCSHFCSSFILFEDPSLPQGLEHLKIYTCPALKSLPEGILMHTRIRRINITDCGSLEFCCSHKEEGLPTSIESFVVSKVKKMEFPRLIYVKRMQSYSSLWSLLISNDVGLVSFPLGVLPKLRYLILTKCENMKNIYLPEGEGIAVQNRLMSLTELEISDCPKLEYVAKKGLPAPNLKTLKFSGCENLKSLPSGMQTRELKVVKCPALKLNLGEGFCPSPREGGN